MLQAYFEGKRELFDGLAMAELEKDWGGYPVFKFDLSLTNYKSVSDLNSVLNANIYPYEKQYGSGGHEDEAPGVRLHYLIRRAYEQTGKQPVVLIDEYDAPLVDVIRDESFEQMREMLQGFYKVLKESTAYLRFVFLTGITKFNQLSIFSALNNLQDITMEPRYAAICGITKEEIITELMPEVEDMANGLNISVDVLLAKLIRKYDGYHFTQDCSDIYNPFSLMNCLKGKELKNYWYSTGTPTFLT